MMETASLDRTDSLFLPSLSLLCYLKDGADHLSGSGSHDELMRMFNMAAAGQGLK